MSADKERFRAEAERVFRPTLTAVVLVCVSGVLALVVTEAVGFAFICGAVVAYSHVLHGLRRLTGGPATEPEGGE